MSEETYHEKWESMFKKYSSPDYEYESTKKLVSVGLKYKSVISWGESIGVEEGSNLTKYFESRPEYLALPIEDRPHYPQYKERRMTKNEVLAYKAGFAKAKEEPEWNYNISEAPKDGNEINAYVDMEMDNWRRTGYDVIYWVEMGQDSRWESFSNIYDDDDIIAFRVLTPLTPKP